MHESLNRNTFLVKEQVGYFRAGNHFDIYDPETGELILKCREELGIITKLLRFTDYKRLTPFNIVVTTPYDEPVLRVHRGISFFLSKVDVDDENGVRVGGFKQKFLSIGGAFNVLGPNDELLCTLKGKWTSWDFRFLAGENELARVTKKWAGIGRELFTTADNYVLQIDEDVPPDNPARLLIMASVLCIDMVLKE